MPLVLLACYVAALVYGTLYPWHGWRSLGVSPFTFLTEPIGPYVGKSDVVTNLLMYMPMAALITLTRFARRRPLVALLMATVAAGLLSLSLESIQSYIPSRVASKLDVLLNTAGALAGGAVGLFVNWRTRDLPHGLWHRPDLFRAESGITVILLIAWIVAQAAPQRMLFETGAVLESLLRLLNQQLTDGTLPATWGPWVTTLSGLVGRWTSQLRPLADHAALIESASIAASLTAVGLITTDALARNVSRASGVAAVLLLGFAMHMLSSAWIVPGQNQMFLLSAGAQGGLLTGGVLLVLLASAKRRSRLWLALVLLVVSVTLANLFSPSVYQDARVPGLLGVRRNLDALLRAMAMAWPFAAIVVLIAQLRSLATQRGRHRGENAGH